MSFGLESDSKSFAFLQKTFPISPESVLYTRDGTWRNRKLQWMALGIQSEVSRGETLVKGNEDLVEKINGMGVQELETALEQGRLSWNEAAGAYGGIPDNPEAAIPSFYTKVNAGKSKWRVMAEFFLREGAEAGGVSIFDPVLCEALYRWYSKRGDICLDPFAGGSVRGIVAALLGRSYWGIELREEQVESNRSQAKDILSDSRYIPTWIIGDSRKEDRYPKNTADFLFSCPPYGSLEKYSDDPEDLSTLSWEEFSDQYRKVISLSSSKLKQGGYACFVVGNYRESQAKASRASIDSIWRIRDLVGLTISAFEEAGCQFWDEAIFVTAVGSAAIRTGSIFERGARKLVKVHQNVLVFRKGGDNDSDQYQQ